MKCARAHPFFIILIPDCIRLLCGMKLKNVNINISMNKVSATAATPLSNLHKFNRILNYDFIFSQRFISDVQFGFGKCAAPLELHNLLFMQHVHCCNLTLLNGTYGSDIYVVHRQIRVAWCMTDGKKLFFTTFLHMYKYMHVA